MTTHKNKKSKAISTLESIAGEDLSFAKLVHSTRLGMELSQEEFGKIFGVNRAYICDIEKGRTDVSVEQALKFAEKLGKSKIVFVQLAIEDQCRRYGLNYEVKLTEKAS